jgi:hypothetical protein
MRPELLQSWDELGAMLPLLTGKELEAGRKGCQELKWKPWDKNLEVCAQSMLPPAGKCYSGDYKKSTEICAGVGGRLCTAAEISAGAAVGTGCGFDEKRVWTSDTCPLGAITLQGNGHAGMAKECMSKDKVLAIRCCSDQAAPTDAPTLAPTTLKPTSEPTIKPTATDAPTAMPTTAPTGLPSEVPSFSPSAVPTFPPTRVPTDTPTEVPTTIAPTEQSTANPTTSAPTHGAIPVHVVSVPDPTPSPMPACFRRGHSELAITLNNARMMLHDVAEGVLLNQISHEIHQIVKSRAAKVSVIHQKAEGLTVNVTIENDWGGYQARSLVDFVRTKRYEMFPNFFPMRIVRVVCTDWLRVPEPTNPPSFAPTRIPTDAPTTHKEEFEMEGMVNGYQEEDDANTGPFVHHTCVRLAGGHILDFPTIGYGNRVQTKMGFTGVPVTRTQCLAACKDITKCSGVEYYPFYRECWLYSGKPSFVSHPTQATEDKCWTGYLKEEWNVPYRSAFTGENERPERFVPVPKTAGATTIVNGEGAAIVPVAVAKPRVLGYST